MIRLRLLALLLALFLLPAAPPAQEAAPPAGSAPEPPGAPAPPAAVLPGPPGTVSVDEVVALALANNLSLRAALLDEEIERAKIREALGAFDPVIFGNIVPGRSEVLFPANFPLDPGNPNSPTVSRIISQKSTDLSSDLGVRGVLDTGMSYELTFRNRFSDRAEETEFNPTHNNSTSIVLNQPLLRGAWGAYGEAPAELARLGAISARETWRGTVRDKVREVQGAYYDLVFFRWDLEVKRQSLEVAEEQVRLTTVRVESGALPRIELTSAESGRAGRRVDLVTAESKVVEAEDRLRRLVLSFDDPADWDRRLIPAESPAELYYELRPASEILAMAERVEPVLLRAHLAVAQAEIILGQRESERKPKLDLRAEAEFTGLDREFWQSHRIAYSEGQGAASVNLGLSLEFPFGNRAAAARVAQSELAVRKARIQLQDARTELMFQVRNALRNIDLARRSIASRKEASRLAAEQLANERLKLEVKTSTNFQVFQVEDQLNLRRTEEIRAILDYRLALLDLSRVTGLALPTLIAGGG